MSRLTFPAAIALASGATACAMKLPRTVDVRVTESAVGVAGVVAPGPALLHLTNASATREEVRLILFRTGISPDSGRALLSLGAVPDSLGEVAAALSARAGETAAPQVYLELMSGRVYGLVSPRQTGTARYAVFLSEEERKP